MSTSIRIPIAAIASVAVASIGVTIPSAVAAISTTIAASAATATTETSSAVVLGGHLLDVDLVAVDGGRALLDHLLGGLLSVEGDEAEILWFIIFALVNRPDHFSNWPELSEIILDVLNRDSLGRKLADVDLALLGLGLLARDLLALDHVRLLSTRCIQTLGVLEDEECKSARASGVRVGLEVDVVDLAVLAKVLLDVQVLCLLRDTSNK